MDDKIKNSRLAGFAGFFWQVEGWFSPGVTTKLQNPLYQNQIMNTSAALLFYG